MSRRQAIYESISEDGSDSAVGRLEIATSPDFDSDRDVKRTELNSLADLDHHHHHHHQQQQQQSMGWSRVHFLKQQLMRPHWSLPFVWGPRNIQRSTFLAAAAANSAPMFVLNLGDAFRARLLRRRSLRVSQWRSRRVSRALRRPIASPKFI